MSAAAILVSYLMGGIPFALLAARLKGVDLRAQGSGNLGATNAIRVLGPAIGFPVLIADVLKGLLAAGWVPRLFGHTEGGLPLACGTAAIAGHVWPVFLGFSGGKGVATAAGAFLALDAFSVGMAIAVFALVLLLSRFVSLASICAAIVFAFMLWVRGASWPLLLVGVAVAVLVVVRHRTNVSRLLAGTENRVHFRRSERTP